LSFIGVDPFVEKSMFDFWIASSIKNNKIGSLERLRDLIKATCLRRRKALIGDSLELPRRLEVTENVELHQTDSKLYEFFKIKTAKMAASHSSLKGRTPEIESFKESNILSLINFLRLICNHGKLLLPQSALEIWTNRDNTSFDWQTMRNWIKRCDMCEAELELRDYVASNGSNPPCEHSICSKCSSQSKYSTVEEESICPKCASESRTTNKPGLQSPSRIPIRPSAKIEALLRNLRPNQTSQTGTVIKR
jgi:SNF2 family DNA or RNA helicase